MENAKKKMEELELEDSIRFASSKRLILKWLASLCVFQLQGQQRTNPLKREDFDT